MRPAPLLVACILMAGGLTPAQPAEAADDFAIACEVFGSAQVVFVGRAQPPETRRLAPGESEIAGARAEVARTDAELRRIRSSDVQTKQELEFDATVRYIRADAELKGLQAMFPRPSDALGTPMRVETAFRGVATSEVFLLLGPQPPLEPGRSYLVFARPLLPFISDMSDVFFVAGPARDVDSAGEYLRFLNLAASGIHGTTVYGALRLEDPEAPNGPGQPMGGVSIRFSSGAYVVEATTKKDGTFMVAGLPAGILEIEVALPEQLTIRDRSALKREVMGSGCVPLNLHAALNGRLRGTIFGERGIPLSRGEVDLIHVDPRRAEGTRGRFDTRTNEDGEFEFVGVPPGDYWLGVNLVERSRIGPAPAPTYFPGTRDRNAAIPIRVGPATEQGGLTFSIVQH
jgi:hypothetical protein